MYVCIYSAESSSWRDVETLAKTDKRESSFQFYATTQKTQLCQFKFTEENKKKSI